MTPIDYQRMFQDARSELESLHVAKTNLEAKLAEVNAKIEAMTKTYNAIAPLVGVQPIPGLWDTVVTAAFEALMAGGISVSVRAILDESPQQIFTAASMRDALKAKGWDWSKYTNPLATVHTVLVRLVESGAAREDTSAEGAKAFHSNKRLEPIKAPASLFGLGTGINAPPLIPPVSPPKPGEFGKKK